MLKWHICIFYVFFVGWLDCFVNNLKFDQNSILWRLFLFYETLSKQKLTWRIFNLLETIKKSYTKCGHQYTDKYLFSIVSAFLKTFFVVFSYVFFNAKKQKIAFILKRKEWQVSNYITCFFFLQA